MCFYYSISKKNTDILIENWEIKNNQLEKIPEQPIVNGFQNPIMPVITNSNPNEISLFLWGLIPSNINSSQKAVDFRKSYNTLNAKSESIFKSKIYSQPVKSNRCLVLATGFFEWQHVSKHKIPYYISLKDDSLFAFAGIWDSWVNEDGEKHYTYSILTTKANKLLSEIHNTKKRMPMILTKDSAVHWLSPNLTNNNIEQLTQPINDEYLKSHTIKNFLSPKFAPSSAAEVFEEYDYSEILKQQNNGNSANLLDYSR